MADPDYEYIGDGRPGGTVVGRSSATVTSANALLGFFGRVPIARPAAITSVSTAAITSVATAAVASSAGVYGFATAAAGDGVIAAVNALITRAGVLTTEGNAIVTALSSASGLGLIA